MRLLRSWGVHWLRRHLRLRIGWHLLLWLAIIWHWLLLHDWLAIRLLRLQRLLWLAVLWLWSCWCTSKGWLVYTRHLRLLHNRWHWLGCACSTVEPATTASRVADPIATAFP